MILRRCLVCVVASTVLGGVESIAHTVRDANAAMVQVASNTMTPFGHEIARPLPRAEAAALLLDVSQDAVRQALAETRGAPGEDETLATLVHIQTWEPLGLLQNGFSATQDQADRTEDQQASGSDWNAGQKSSGEVMVGVTNMQQRTQTNLTWPFNEETGTKLPRGAKLNKVTVVIVVVVVIIGVLAVAGLLYWSYVRLKRRSPSGEAGNEKKKGVSSSRTGPPPNLGVRQWLPAIERG